MVRPVKYVRVNTTPDSLPLPAGTDTGRGGNCTPTQRGLIYFAYPELYCHKITNFAKNTRPCGDGIKQTTLPRPRPWAIVS